MFESLGMHFCDLNFCTLLLSVGQALFLVCWTFNFFYGKVAKRKGKCKLKEGNHANKVCRGNTRHFIRSVFWKVWNGQTLTLVSMYLDGFRG